MALKKGAWPNPIGFSDKANGFSPGPDDRVSDRGMKTSTGVSFSVLAANQPCLRPSQIEPYRLYHGPSRKIPCVRGTRPAAGWVALWGPTGREDSLNGSSFNRINGRIHVNKSFPVS